MALTPTQRRNVEILTAQGATPEQIAEAERLPLDDVKAAVKPKGQKAPQKPASAGNE